MSVQFSLADRLRRAYDQIPDGHRIRPRSGEGFESLKILQKRLQDYAFCNGFAIVQTAKEMKKRVRVTYKCYRHGKKTLNTRKLTEETRKRHNTHERNLECPYMIRVRYSKPNREWTLSISESNHNHDMLEDPFFIRENYRYDPDRKEALTEALDLRRANISYSSVKRVLAQKGFRLTDRNAYYNLVHNPKKRTPHQEAALALHRLDERGGILVSSLRSIMRPMKLNLLSSRASSFAMTYKSG